MQPEPILFLTRPEAAAKRFLAGLPENLRKCFRPVISPLLKIVPVGGALDIGQANGLILTSSNSVAQAANLNLPDHVPVYTVGAATARAARAAGWDAVMVGKNAEELVANLPGVSPATPLLHLHGRHARGEIAARLTAQGLPTKARVIYDQVAQSLSEEANDALSGNSPVVVPLFSPRTAALFSDSAAPSCPLRIIAFSPAVAEHVHISDTTELHICAEPTEMSMHAALCDAARALCRVEGS